MTISATNNFCRLLCKLNVSPTFKPYTTSLISARLLWLFFPVILKMKIVFFNEIGGEIITPKERENILSRITDWRSVVSWQDRHRAICSQVFIVNWSTFFSLKSRDKGPGWVLLGILCGDVPLGSPNPVLNTCPICDWLHVRDRRGAASLDRHRNRAATGSHFCVWADRSPHFLGGANAIRYHECEHSLRPQVVFLSFLRECKVR